MAVIFTIFGDSAFVHLYIVYGSANFNSMMRIDGHAEAAHGGAHQPVVRQISLSRSTGGIIIGSIFVITIVMGDFLTIGVMSG